jgi:hypothetical protein
MLETLLSYFSESFLVIDALDECHDDVARQIRNIFLRAAKCRIMVTTRPYSTKVGQDILSWPSIDILADDGDVRNYLESHVGEQLGDIIAEHPDLGETVVSTIVKKSCGMSVTSEGSLVAVILMISKVPSLSTAFRLLDASRQSR